MESIEIIQEFDFEILETSEATAIEEMGASSTFGSGSTCQAPPVPTTT